MASIGRIGVVCLDVSIDEMYGGKTIVVSLVDVSSSLEQIVEGWNLKSHQVRQSFRRNLYSNSV